MDNLKEIKKEEIAKDNNDKFRSSIENAEIALLSLILNNNDEFYKITELIDSVDFIKSEHQILFKLIQEEAYTEKKYNHILLQSKYMLQTEHIKDRDPLYIHKIYYFSEKSDLIVEYAQKIKKFSLKRKLIDFLDNAKTTIENEEGVSNDLLNNIEERFYKLINSFYHKTKEITKLEDLTPDLIEEIKNPTKGINTEFKKLDNLIGGLKKSDLIVLAARPSMGKTAFATNIATNIAKNKVVLFFSLEMSNMQIGMRILSMFSNVNSHFLTTGKISDNKLDDILKSAGGIKKLDLFIDDTSAITVDAIKSKSRHFKIQNKDLSCIIIDYLQLIRTKRVFNNKVQEISEITQSLKALSKEIDVPVIVLSQLSRASETRENKRPMLSDLRDSGSIEQDADIVMFIYREVYYLERDEPKPQTEEHVKWMQKMEEIVNKSEIIISKHRNGATGNISLNFEKTTTNFSNIEDGEDIL